ncbi:MAG: hypothetical protein JXA17_03835 [Dehalococcoidales bacterium]|nr:hypothetical protein [Dehalococcoidales bacterium]
MIFPTTLAPADSASRASSSRESAAACLSRLPLRLTASKSAFSGAVLVIIVFLAILFSRVDDYMRLFLHGQAAGITPPGKTRKTLDE